MNNFNNFGAPAGLVDLNGMAFQQPALQPAMGFSQNLTPAPMQQSLIQTSYEFGTPMGQQESNDAQSMRIRKVYMGLTRPQLDQHRRSYDVMMTGDGFNAMQEKIDRYGVDAFSTKNVSNVLSTSDIIKPSGQAEAPANIDNGWRANRYAFILVADIYRNGRFTRTEYIKGYTDNDNTAATGFGMDVAIAPDMVFTINHISSARIQANATGDKMIPMISGSNSVMINSNYSSFSNTNENLYLMRPSDVLRGVDKVEMHKGMVEAAKFGAPGTGITYCDLDSTLTHVPMMSADTNNLIPTFTGRILNGLYRSKLNPMDPMNMDGTAGGDTASILMQDDPFSKHGFVNLMNRVTGNYVSTTGRFSYSDLLSLDPTIDDRVSVFGRSYETGTISFPSATNCALMGATESIAVAGTMVAHTTLSLMAMAGVTTLGFNANNHGGSTHITWQALEGMDYDGQLAMRMEHLKVRLIVECLNIISIDDKQLYNIDIFADAINDLFIKIRIENEYREYIFPSFGHAGTLPTVTNDISRLTDVSTQVDQIVGMLSDRQSDHSAQFGNNVFAAGNGDARIGGMSGSF